ncbi:hypothetical protein WICPIJ_007273 [Wickerhamomyces pijperi]|uniref:Integral membrane bound transporter domain-containing protein n=1 Tax=Wickerhamomyces pijperi TaxID=599730 RepID=A0A9P8TK80_WICPI|nr:hypothetical protein WICPIJ_007273 [Wickerhamomyces pijperi]
MNINNPHSSTPENEHLLSNNGTPWSTSPNQLRHYNSINSNTSFDLDADRFIKNNIIGRGRSPNTAPRLIKRISAILASTGERTRRWSTNVINDGTTTEEDLEAQNQDQRDSHLNHHFTHRCLNSLACKLHIFTEWLFSHKYELVLKCSLAYLLASLAVYNPHFSKLIGHSDSKHVVATVAVYFHPSRTIGSMHQSLIFVVISLIFSFSISLISTGIASQLHCHGHSTMSAITNLVIASLAQACISYMKQFMNHATFNVACSLASMSVISAIVKEGSQSRDGIPWQRLSSLFTIVCCGCFITVAVCYLIMPSSAEVNLKGCLNECCSLMSSYLTQIETSFLNGGNVNSDEQLLQLGKKLKKKMASLNSMLEETKYELYLVGKEDQYHRLLDLVRSLQFLGSQLGGLKLSADMQWTILHNHEQGEADSVGSSLASSANSIRTIDSDGSLPLLSTSNVGGPNNSLHQSQTTISSNEMTALNSSQLFDLFIHYLGPSLKSLCYTIKGVLDDVPFTDNSSDSPSHDIIKDTYHYKNSLKLAGELFDGKYAEALKKLYAQRMFKQTRELDPIKSKIDEEEIAAACGNFASNLSEFSKGLERFLGLLEQYSESLEDDHRSWGWSKVWKMKEKRATDSFGAPAVGSGGAGSGGPGLDFALRKLNTTFQYRTGEEETSATVNSWSFKLWNFFSFFRKVEAQFSIRVSLGFFVLASLAYLPLTKTVFNEWRGEWALVTYSIVMNKSLGGTTMTVNWRFIGTLMGCLSAYILWTISDGNVYVLCVSGWVISLFSFKIILGWPENNAFGRFILLTYNITALYSFNITATSDDIEGDTDLIIADIATHRFLSVMGGVLWAVVMTVTFLPMTARHRLKRGLAILWLRLGIIWNTDPLSHKDMVLTGLAGQRGINHIMRELELLLKQAPKETRLKGPFRLDIYKKLMHSTETIIDAYQNINSIISVDPKLSSNELIVLNTTTQERDELQNRIFLIFYMISSSITLGIPLPSKPASTEHSKDRIMVQLAQIRNDDYRSGNEFVLAPEDYVLLYSYVLVSNVVTNELNKIINLLGELYGLVNEETLEI